MKTRILAILLTASFCLGMSSASGEVVTAYEGHVTLPTYPWQPDIRHPYFPETDGRNIYPYTMQDDIRPDRAPRTYRTVVLESDLIKIVFIPELGGRIWDATDKVTGKPIFYVNHVVKPGLIAMRGAWISGGVEFNAGPQIHTVSAISPVDVLILPTQQDGSRSVAVGEIERINRLQWTAVVTLRPGRRFIEEKISIYNRMETTRPYYFWNCTAQPNTLGFRFVYPMTLGTDHAGRRFYQWPVNDGVDLSWGKHYRRMSSIFAYECDQDFFGSYDMDQDRGCVAFADRRQLPGKKAWTWSWGGDGVAHQAMLTDDDGPYNEVQTGPLHTQAETGRLDPHEMITWREWWYPVHALGGPFTFANKDICARAEVADGKLDLRLIGTGTWKAVIITVSRAGQKIESRHADMGPVHPLSMEIAVGESPVLVDVSHHNRTLTSFSVPLPLPKREPPEDAEPDRSPEGIASEGWKSLLLRRRDAAMRTFQQALEKDEGCVEALLGLAHYKLTEALPAQAESLSRRAVEQNQYDGRAHYVLAVALHRQGKQEEALDSAWKAALDPAAAVPARALAAKILIRQKKLEEAVEALSAPGPWQNDPLCRDRLSIALLQLGRPDAAEHVALNTVEKNPLDTLALYVLARANRAGAEKILKQLLRRDPECTLELAFALAELGLNRQALHLLSEETLSESPMAWYTANYLRGLEGLPALDSQPAAVDGVFPSRLEELPVLEYAVQTRPNDSLAHLLLGDLQFHLRRHAQAREIWKKSAEVDASNSVALRALGIAAWKLDGDLARAERYLRQALTADRNDGIVARDLARAIQAQADRAKDGAEKNVLLTKARDALSQAVDANIHRADIVEMLATLHNRLEEPEKAAALLDRIRVTSWEGAQGLHDEFRKAHFVLGKRHFEAERFADAVDEFRRSLDYPSNLGIGRREGTREADLYYWLGLALSKTGKQEEARTAWQRAADEPPSGRDEIERCRKLAQEALKE